VRVLPEPGVLLAALVSGAFGGVLVLLILAVRGSDPTALPSPEARPPSLPHRLGTALRSPGLSSRLAAGVAVGVGTLLVTRWPVAAAGLAALVVAWPRLFGGARAEQQQINRLEALVVWTESLRDTVGGHASLEQAIPVTAHAAPPLIRPALLRLVGQLRARLPLDKALLRLAAELDDASADLVLAALILNVQRRGDGLGQVLSGLAVAAREELDMRQRVCADRAGLRRGVQIVVVMTIGFGAFLILIGGAYVRPYDTAAGQLALTVVLGMFAAGFAWMRQLSGSAEIMPFLARPGRHPDPRDLAVVANLTGLSTTAAAGLSAGPRDNQHEPLRTSGGR
jgi:tight adherence protein B